jgi:hypothetical protein
MTRQLIVVLLTCSIFCPSVLAGTFRDDFEDGNWDGWRMLKGYGELGWLDQTAQWFVEQGELVSVSKDVYTLASLLGIGDSTWVDYEFEFEFKIEDVFPYGWPSKIGFGVHFDDSNEVINGMDCIIREPWNYHFCEWFLDGVHSTSGEVGSISISLGEWHTARAVVEGDRCRRYVNDILLCDSRIDLPDSGGIMLAGENCEVHFDNVVITGDDIPDTGPSGIKGPFPSYSVEFISRREGRVTGGEPIFISGNGFPLGAIVTVGDKPLTDITVTDTVITGHTPPGIEGEQDIRIVLPDLGYSISIGKFLYNPLSNIVVTNVIPNNGRQSGGNICNVVGSGFLPDATVAIDGNPATVVSVMPALITFTVPPGAEGAKDVLITNPDGQKATLRGGYTYNPFPVIKKVEPRHGGPLRGGTDMTITGSNFMEGVVVTIGEKRVQQLAFFSPTELRLETPPGTAGPKPVRVTNPDGQAAVEEDGFTYNPAPTISSISPNAGPLEGGTPIAITGREFISRADVIIGDAEAKVERTLPTKITALTPLSDAGVKDVTVRNPDGQRATLRDAFTYNDAPVITRVTPDNGRLAGGTRITVQGGGFQPGAELRISIGQGAYRAASSVEVMSSSVITALTPPGQPGAENVLVLNPDIQIAVLPEGFTYNHKPTITRLIPNHGPSSGGATITIEGSGFLLGARVVIGEKAATTMVRDDMTIEAVAPPNPQGVWNVRVINPDTQEVVKPGGYVSAGEVAYNYPNPFYASQGTTFRFVTKDPVLSVTVKIFNLRGRPIGAARQLGSNEVKWVDPDVHAGLYIYILEAEMADGRKRRVRNVMEVIE